MEAFKPGNGVTEQHKAMIKVIAKFRVTEKMENTLGKPEDGHYITLVPVIGGSKENDEFYKWTPGGAISLGTVNPAASAAFVENAQYYVTFEAADAASKVATSGAGVAAESAAE